MCCHAKLEERGGYLGEGPEFEFQWLLGSRKETKGKGLSWGECSSLVV